MDDIESFISGISSTEDKSYIDRAREYLSGLNKDELKEFLEKHRHVEKFNANAEKAAKEQPIQWSAVSKMTHETGVLIYIYNTTRENFSLTKASWDSSQLPLKEFDLGAGDYTSFILRDDRLRRISNAKSIFRSSKIKHEFTYKSAERAFTFSTEAQLYLRYEPLAFGNTTTVSRQYNTRSTGKTELLCSTELTQRQNASPYSYAMKIVIREAN
ncbi:hypothetical protein N8H74_19125 [Pseudomonas sp. B2M1-30]|uniref:hypothetical protein n=1 Tax=Pseudomonas TaxID=286 RepID=UPI0021C6E9B8|nr:MULTISPECIES: hypothetical protein [Pseudomonas]MCU0120382.1 hypothetical protein [Pseudomonas sp. B2M1-30]MCU7262400.1 hypothetical protein [Pseudomonas koreensis]